jgi:hypothetical protein
MAEPPERLFRDDAGAALERVHRLEQENQALRAEIEGFKAGRPSPVPLAYRIGTLALSVATMAVGATLTFAGDPARPQCEPPPVYVSPPPTFTVPPPPPAVYHPDLNDCTIPYWYDAQNVKHYKAGCLSR